MLYTYCKKSLTFNRVEFKKLTKIALIGITFLAVSYTGVYTMAKRDALEQSLDSMSTEQKAILVNDLQKNEFSKEALVAELKKLNVKFPYIVLAQSMIESGHFQSNIFRENNNLFGMKQAMQRVTTALGTQNNHAYYENWRESVLDYAMFQSSYLRDIKTETAYMEYLGANYAEASNYRSAIQKVIEEEKLKELFN
jgi:hypothetical protein